MGIIQKQTIKGTSWSYIGAVIGFINVGILMPKLFSTNEIGLINLILAISYMLSQFGNLGFTYVTNRLFPYFRDEKNKHHGFFPLMLFVSLFGFVFVTIIYLLFSNWIIGINNGESNLMNDYSYWIIILTFVNLFFNIFDSYFKMLYNAIIGIFVKEFFLRILNLIAILLFCFELININQFVIIYFIGFLLQLLIMVLYLVIRKEFSFRVDFKFIKKDISKEIIQVALFGIIAGFSSLFVTQIDKYMVGKMMGLSSTGIYYIAYFFGVLILIPSRSLSKISSTIIAESWKNKDYTTISEIHKKSSINQYIFGLLLFIGVWANRANIFRFLPVEYQAGEFVIFLIGLSSVVIMASGASNYIVATSVNYRVDTYFLIAQIFITVWANLIFIPIWGINGAALSSLITVVFYRGGSVIYTGLKYKIWPFCKGHLIATTIAIGVYFGSILIPQLDNLYIDIFVRSASILIGFAYLVLHFKVSGELTSVARSLTFKVLKARLF